MDGITIKKSKGCLAKPDAVGDRGQARNLGMIV